MSKVTAAPPARTLVPDREHALAQDVLGLPQVLFCIVTGAAPLAALLFNVPVAVSGGGYAVPADELDAATLDLITRATRGSALSKGLGKQGFYAQVDLDQHKAYAYATELMAASSQTPDAREGMLAFLEKRAPRFIGR